MADEFEKRVTALSDTASNAAIAVPGASALANTTRALLILADGNLGVTTKGGQSPTAFAVVTGMLIPLRCTHILGTTTATVLLLW